MEPDALELGRLIMGMRAAHARGENVMAWSRANFSQAGNALVSTLVAYDLQAGRYVENTRANPNYYTKWCAQLAGLIEPYVEVGDKVMEVGCGEATTLAWVMKELGRHDLSAFGFDVSWSRINVAKEWIAENSVAANLFVSDLFYIPLADNSIDIIYTSHSLEPNGGQEEAALRELLRVARKAVVLVEPIYELATAKAQERMVSHGYVRELKSVAESLGADVVEYGLLDVCENPLNPSGVVLMIKPDPVPMVAETIWQCPLTGTSMSDQGDLFLAEKVGMAYPVMRGIPLLRKEHGVVASRVDR